MTRGLKLVGLLLGTIVVGWLSMGASDTQPPVINISSPSDGGTYVMHQPIEVAWTAEDSFPGSGLKSVLATQDSGKRLDTSQAGQHVFTVVAEDRAGNRAQRQVRYWVVYDVTMEKPLAPSAFEGEAPPTLTVDAGTEIPFSFSVRDFRNRKLTTASGTVNVLDAETREIVYLDEDGVGLLAFDAETESFNYTLDTDPLSTGVYRVLVQFNDGRTIFRIDLRLE